MFQSNIYFSEDFTAAEPGDIDAARAAAAQPDPPVEEPAPAAHASCDAASGTNAVTVGNSRTVPVGSGNVPSPVAIVNRALPDQPVRTLRAALSEARDIYGSTRDMRAATAAINRPVTLSAAMSDVTQTGMSTIFPQTALSELWTPYVDQASMVGMVSNMLPLTEYHIVDWLWAARPVVDDYAGDKADIPSGDVSIDEVDLKALTLAGGHDIDRALVDFNTGFRESYWSAMIADTGSKLAQRVLSAIRTGGTAKTATSFVKAVTTGARQLMSVGGQVSYLICSPDVWEIFANMNTDSLPLWAQSSIVDLSMGSFGSLAPGQIPLLVDVLAPSGTLTVGDKRATTTWSTGSIQAEVVNVGQGGIDLGVFTYYQKAISAPTAIANITGITGA